VRFEELGWTFTGTTPWGRHSKRRHFKVLLVSHSAGRTGAPLCALRVAEELAKRPGFECSVVLQSGGELEAEFARVAPTIQVATLVERGILRTEVAHVIASAFRAYATRGIAICNTMAVSDFHPALAQADIPILSWVHELPTMVNLFGGLQAVARIRAASHQIFVPSNAVREAWIEHFGIEPARIRTAYTGTHSTSDGLDRQAVRLRVRKELGLPEDARIVLGCGTVDLRKGTDLFIQVAGLVLTGPDAGKLAAKTWFVWVGHCSDASLRAWLSHDAAKYGVEERVVLAGLRDDTAPYFLASDVFALTSREDPCPATNVEAMESGLPVVAFEDAGGAPEVLRDAGITVPYLDVPAMAAAVKRLVACPETRRRMGELGRTFVRKKLTWSRFNDQLLEVLRDDFGYYAPQTLSVSVILPNYCHAQYLEERFQSIFRQTLQPHEIIFLDDASPDGSVDLARQLAARSPIPMRIVVNVENSGSTFRQWMKGLELATGDLVWIAESDDSCHADFLQRLVPAFYDPEVNLAYSQSALIGPDGETISADFLDHTNDISPTRWRSPYCVTGAEEAELALSQKNTIPNESAVLFRHPKNLDFADELGQLRFAGDLLFYAMLLRSGKIAYLPDALNFYRRHEQTVSHQAIRGDTHVEESLRVKARVIESFPVSTTAIARCLAQSVYEYHWLAERFRLDRPPLSSNPKATHWLDRIGRILEERLAPGSSRRILLVLQDMTLEGATVSRVHLANAMALEQIVYLCNARPSRCHPRIVAMVDPRVIYLEGCPGPTAWSDERDHPGDGPDFAGERRVRIIKDLVRIHRIDVIQSCSPATDDLVVRIDDARGLAASSLSARTAG
jgi:glycosyltransferase involved in cell wall biosynthesis